MKSRLRVGMGLMRGVSLFAGLLAAAGCARLKDDGADGSDASANDAAGADSSTHADGGASAKDGASDASDAAAPGDAATVDGSLADTGADSGDDATTDASDGGAPDSAPCTTATCPVATGQARPYALAADDTHVYFTNQSANAGSIMRISADGGVTPVVTGLHGPTDLLALSTELAWLSDDSPSDAGSNTGSVGRISKTGGIPSFPVTGLDPGIAGIAVYNSRLFWGAPGGIFDIASDSELLNESIDVDSVSGFVADVTGIYTLVGAYGGTEAALLWIEDIGTSGGLDTRQNVLYSYPTTKVGGPVTMDDLYVYYSLQDDGTINLFSKDNLGEPVILASNQTNVAAMTVDAAGGYLYWTTRGSAAAQFHDGTVMKVAIAGGDALPIATAQPEPHGILIHGENVYWTNLGDGTVMSSPK